MLNFPMIFVMPLLNHTRKWKKNMARMLLLQFVLLDSAPVTLQMTAGRGLEAQETVPFVVLSDQPPDVRLLDARQQIIAQLRSQVPVEFQVDDDYGVARVGLERIIDAQKTEAITTVPAEKHPKTFPGRFVIDLASFDVRYGDTLETSLVYTCYALKETAQQQAKQLRQLEEIVVKLNEAAGHPVKLVTVEKVNDGKEEDKTQEDNGEPGALKLPGGGRTGERADANSAG